MSIERNTETTNRLISKYNRETLSATEAAHELNLSPQFVRRECQAGKIAAVKYGRVWLIQVSEIAAILSGTKTATSPFIG